jgi:prevent-host-death family protein
MANGSVPVEKVKATDARTQWSQLLNRVFRTRSRVVIEKSGIPVAAIVPIADYKWLQRMDAKREHDFAAINEIGKAFADVPLDELQREVDKAVAEVKRENLEARRSQHSA